jgi:hypothetical protein
LSGDLLVIVPTRGRRAQCERLLEKFTETASPGTDLLVVIDPDDRDTYAGIDWGRAAVTELAPREYLSGKLNKTALANADTYDALAWLADDCVPITPAWDRILLAALEDLGSGWVYPDDKRRSDVPELWMASADIVKALGWFANPACAHFYLDNSIAELGQQTGLLRWCPQAVIEHRHHSICADTRHDAVYRSTEAMFGASDHDAFLEWQAGQMAAEVEVLRRNFRLPEAG